MAKDNITPIYGEWILKHLNYYQFIGTEAEKLEQDFRMINLNALESDRYLIEYYRRFLALFVNSMHDVAFENYEAGIITTYKKAFLVENEYGVMAPIEFLEEYGRDVCYEPQQNMENIIKVFSEKDAEIIKYVEDRKGDFLTISQSTKKASRFRGIFIFILIIIILVYIVKIGEDKIKVDFQFLYLQIVWILVILGVLIGIWKAIGEMKAAKKWDEFVLLQTWMIQKAEELKTSELGKHKEINEYLIKLKETQNENGQIPISQIKVSDYTKEINLHIVSLNKMLGNQKTFQRKIGKFMMSLLIASVIFVVYGEEKFDFLRTKISDFNLLELVEIGKTKEIEISKSVKNRTKIMGYDPIYIDGAIATSFLKTSSGIDYNITNTYDIDMDTCWQDGVEGNGEGEKLSYRFDTSYPLYYIEIVNGRVSSEENYYNNNRICELTVYCYLNGEEVLQNQVMLEDVFTIVPQKIFLGDENNGVECDMVEFEVCSVYAGNIYNDLCVTEVTFYYGIYD